MTDGKDVTRVAAQAPTIFSYAYRPIQPVDDWDIPFTINIDAQGILCYDVYTLMQDGQYRSVDRQAFRLSPDVFHRIVESIRYAKPWMRHMPPRIQLTDDPGAEYTFCLDRLPVFRIYDMESLLARDYRSTRGHYTRLVYCLLEDISQLLSRDGLMLTPDTFDPSEVYAPSEAAQA